MANKVSKLKFNNVTYDLADESSRVAINNLEGQLEATRVDLNNMRAAVGSPLTAATTSAMTDTSKIYVYTGTTTTVSSVTFTAGNWYYHDGTKWQLGGTYNETALETDTTLTVSGAAADAKVTGDKVTELKSALSDVDSAMFDGGYRLDTSKYVQGTFNGTKFVWGNRARLINKVPIRVNSGATVTIKPNGNDVEWDIFDKVANTGDYDADYQRTSVSSWLKSDTAINITEDDKYLFFIIRNSDNSDITPQTMTATIDVNNTYAFVGITAINKKIESFDPKALMVADNNWVDGYKIGSTGYRNASDISSISPFYPVKKGETLSYDLRFDNATSWFIAFYTKSEFTANNFVAANSIKSIFGTQKGSYVVPADGFVVFCNKTGYSGKIIFNNYVPDYAKNVREFIPAYWQDEVDSAVNTARINALEIGKNIFEFVYVTDTHWTVNAKHSPALINYITDKLKINILMFGGDVITGTQSTREKALDEVYSFYENFDRRIDILSTIGNHDLNNNTSASAELTIDEAYPLYIKSAEPFGLTDKTTMGAVYDNDSQKVRIIQFLHPTSSFVDAEVTRWILSKIAEKTNWTIIVVSHAYWNSEPSGTDLTVNTASTSLGKQIADAFHNNSNAGFWLCGHTHRDYNSTVTSDSGNTLAIVCTTTDAYSYGGSDGGPEMTLGTNTEQAFDIMQIDTDNRKIYATRVGAGLDRVIDY